MIIQPNKELTQAILQYQNGDAAAFDVIYYNSLPYITKCVLNVLNRTAPGASEELQQDIIQDTYMTIADKLNTLQSPAAFFQWAGQIATHHAQRTWNRDLRRQEMEGSAEELDYELMDEDFIPEDILENREKQLMIRQMLDELPTNQYLCIVEYFYNGLKETEVAQKLQMPVNTVKTNLSRAKKKLKTILEDQQKKGIKLYSMSWLLLLLFVKDVELVPLADPQGAARMLHKIQDGMGKAGSASSASASGGAASGAASGGAASGTASGAAASGVGHAVAGVLSTVWGKVVAGVVAVAALAGLAAGGNALLQEILDQGSQEPTYIEAPGDYDPIIGETEGKQSHELMLHIRSMMGEKFTGPFYYSIENIVTGEIVCSGEYYEQKGELDVYGEPISILVDLSQYVITVNAERHRTFRQRLDLNHVGYTQVYADLTTDGSWLTSAMLWRIGHWLQYLQMPVGSQENPAIFINDGSPENEQVILDTMQNILDHDAQTPDVYIYEEVGDEWIPVRGMRLAEFYAQQLFGYSAEQLPKEQLQPSDSEIKYEYVPSFSYYERLDEEHIRVWLKITRCPYVWENDVQHMLEDSQYHVIAATLCISDDTDLEWVLQSAVCYVPDVGLPFADMGQDQEAREPDEAAYEKLISQAVNAWEWEEKGPVILSKEQRERMESVLLCTAYADSGVITRMYVASFGALLADVEVDSTPFLKVTKPAQENWDKLEVLLLLAWNKEPGLSVRQDNSSRCGDRGTIHYDRAVAEQLITGIFGSCDTSSLDTNIVMRGFTTEISDGRIYQPKSRLYDCRYGDGYGTLTIDKLERTGEGTIRIYATYSASMKLSCVYEAVENPDSYIGYTLTGVNYSYAE